MIAFKKVLLVSMPVFKGRHVLADYPPVGLGYLSESLQRCGIEHDVFDMMLGYPVRRLKSLIRNNKYDLLGLSLFTYQYKSSYRIIEEIKKEFPAVTIIVGGPHVSTFREKVLKDCPAIDFGVIMEGEEALAALCQGKAPHEEIPGLMYRQTTEIRSNPPRFIDNLDNVPFPRFAKFEMRKYSSNIAIITSRGCPYACIYCPVSMSIGKKYRYRSAESIAEEIKHWHSKGYGRIMVLDDNFTLLPQRVKTLCGLLKKEKFGRLMLSCSNGIRADKVDMELLKEMRSAGFNEVAFGVEAGTNKVLKAIKKSESIETIENRIREACEAGFKVALFFIIGSPSETYEDFEASLKLASKYPVYSARFYNLIPFPHSELFEWVSANGYFIVPPDEYLNDASGRVNRPLFSTPEFPAELRSKAFDTAQKLDKEIKRKYVESRIRGPRLAAKLVSKIYVNPLVNFLYEKYPVVRHAGLFLRRFF